MNYALWFYPLSEEKIKINYSQRSHSSVTIKFIIFSFYYKYCRHFLDIYFEYLLKSDIMGELGRNGEKLDRNDVMSVHIPEKSSTVVLW